MITTSVFVKQESVDNFCASVNLKLIRFLKNQPDNISQKFIIFFFKFMNLIICQCRKRTLKNLRF